MQEHDTERQLRDEQRRGNLAAELAGNPLLQEALSAYELEITDAWKTSPQRDVDGRERLRMMLDAAKHFRAYLETTVQTGALASTQIQQGMQKSKLVALSQGVRRWL